MTLVLKFKEATSPEEFPSLEEVTRALHTAIEKQEISVSSRPSPELEPPKFNWKVLGAIRYKDKEYNILYNDLTFYKIEVRDEIDKRYAKLFATLGYEKYNARIIFIQSGHEIPRDGTLPLTGLHRELDGETLEFLTRIAQQFKAQMTPKVESVVVAFMPNRDRFEYRRV